MFVKYQDAYAGRSIQEVKSGIADACLDARHNNDTPGSVIDAASCNGRPSQVFDISNSTVTHDGLCLTAPGNPVAANAGIVLEKCNGQAGQVWNGSYLDSLQNPGSGLCLSVPNGNVGAQLIASSCDQLTAPNETWAASTWSKTNNSPASVSCGFSNAGEQIGCYAAKQWIIWKSSGSNHKSLLNTYSDGNGYEEWCADFVSYAYKVAGYPFTSGERDGWDEYIAPDVQYDANFTYHDADSYTPQPGDVAYFDYPGGHVEIVLLGGPKPVFVYGDSATVDKSTGNGDMAENDITQDGNLGQVIYYLSLNG